MTLIPLLEAREMGHRAGVLQSSDMALGLYRKLGFEKLCHGDHFPWREADSGANG